MYRMSGKRILRCEHFSRGMKYIKKKAEDSKQCGCQGSEGACSSSQDINKHRGSKDEGRE